MKSIEGIGLSDVQTVYDGPEGDLWELVMGEQIHIGGLSSSMDLAEKAGVGTGMSGIDLCACNGAGMRFLLRFRDVRRMIGIDATETMVARAKERCAAEGFADRCEFLKADVTSCGMPDDFIDFVWGEDAWCYVEDKTKLVSEAARMVKPGGTVAFTDWVEGPAGLTDEEAARFLRFMKFPGVQDIEGYRGLMEGVGLTVKLAEDTGRFPEHVDLYIDMLTKQLTYDALKIIGFDTDLMGAMAGEMGFMQGLAHAGKIAQGIFIATK